VIRPSPCSALATAQFERYCDRLRNGPRPLTHKEIIALSGIIYREHIENWQDNLGDPEGWTMVMENEVDTWRMCRNTHNAATNGHFTRADTPCEAEKPISSAQVASA
jgi:hypothetical protein